MSPYDPYSLPDELDAIARALPEVSPAAAALREQLGLLPNPLAPSLAGSSPSFAPTDPQTAAEQLTASAPLGSLSGASLIPGTVGLGSLAPGTLPGIDTRQYGVVADGSHNDAAAIQSAIAIAALAGGGVVVLPAGNILLGTTYLTITGDNVSIQGQGQFATTLIYTGSGAAIRNSDTAVLRRRFLAIDLAINNQGAAGAGGIRLENFYDATVERVNFNNPGAGGIGLEFYGTGSTYFNTAHRCFFGLPTAGSTGVKWTKGAADPNSNRVLYSYVSGVANTTGYDMEGGTASTIAGCEVNVGVGGVSLHIGSQSGWNHIVALQSDGNGSITVDGNYNRFVACTMAGTITYTDNGQYNVRVASMDKEGLDLLDLNFDATAGATILHGKLTVKDSESTTTIAGGRITAAGLAVGNLSNLLLNPDFQFGPTSAGTAILGWTKHASAGGNAYVAGGLTPGGNAYVGTRALYVLTAVNQSFTWVESIHFPVSPGEKLAGSFSYKQATGGPSVALKARFYDKDGTTVGSDLTICSDTTSTSSWQRKQGRVTVPANAATAMVYVTVGRNDLVASDAYIGDVVLMRTGATVIDSAGVHIYDGALVVENPGGTVIIDGTTDIIRVAATGTCTRAFPAAPGAVATDVNLSSLGSMSSVPACLFLVTAIASDVSQVRKNGVDQILDTYGAVASQAFGAGYVSSSALHVELVAQSVLSNPGTTAGMRYYVFLQAGI